MPMIWEKQNKTFIVGSDANEIKQPCKKKLFSDDVDDVDDVNNMIKISKKIYVRLLSK
jgi:hypothetical protein